MNRILNIFNKCADSIGLIYGIANIQEILGIIVLVLTIVNIITGYAFKIYDKIKKKNYKGITEDIEDAIEEIKDLNEKDS